MAVAKDPQQQVHRQLRSKAHKQRQHPTKQAERYGRTHRRHRPHESTAAADQGVPSGVRRRKQTCRADEAQGLAEPSTGNERQESAVELAQNRSARHPPHGSHENRGRQLSRLYAPHIGTRNSLDSEDLKERIARKTLLPDSTIGESCDSRASMGATASEQGGSTLTSHQQRQAQRHRASASREILHQQPAEPSVAHRGA